MNSKNSIICKNSVFILKSFSQNQLVNFETFIHSDFFKIQNDVKKLFQLILLKISTPNFIGFKRVELEKFFNQKNKGKPTSYPLAKLSNKTPMNLMKAIEQFLATKELEQNSFTKNHLLMKAYARQGLSAQFEKTSKNATQQLDKNKTDEHTYHLNRFLIYETIYLHPNTNKHLPKIESQKIMLESLDSFFYLTKLRLGVELLLRKNLVKEDKPLFGLDTAQKFAKQNPSFHFQIYTLLLQIIPQKKYQKKTFLTAKNIFEKHIDTWNHEDQRILIQFLINYITSFLNKGHKELFPVQLNIFKFGLKHKILLDHKKNITYATFSNILTTFLACKEFENAQLFVIDYNKYLDRPIRKNAIQFAEGYIAMAQKDFTTAIKKLSSVDKKSEISKLQVSCFLLRSTFEQYLIDPTMKTLLSSSIKRFQHYFRTNKLYTSDRNQGFLKLSRTIEKLCKIREKQITKKQRTLELKALANSVNDEINPIMMKGWLLDTIHNIIKELK